MNGLFITFEGIDSSGKTTQAKLFADALNDQNFKAIYVREPGGSKVSEAIREILLSPAHDKMHARSELLLYAAARAQIVEEIINPAMADGKIVICDRYSDSTMAYQGFGRGLNLDDIKSLLDFATGGLKPDLTLLFDIDLHTAEARRKAAGVEADRLEAESRAFHERVRQGYLQLHKTNQTRITKLDGRDSVGEIQMRVWDIFSSRFSTWIDRQEDRQ